MKWGSDDNNSRDSNLAIARAAVEDRGYRIQDLEKVRQRLRQQRNDWERKFDEYIERMVSNGNGVVGIAEIQIIVERAAKLADARQAELDQRYDPAIEEED